MNTLTLGMQNCVILMYNTDRTARRPGFPPTRWKSGVRARHRSGSAAGSEPRQGQPTHVRLHFSILIHFNHCARQNANETPVFSPSLPSFLLFLPFSFPFLPASNGNQPVFSVIFLNDPCSDDTAPTPFRHFHHCLLLALQTRT
jgi:hypothetical protein